MRVLADRRVKKYTTGILLSLVYSVTEITVHFNYGVLVQLLAVDLGIHLCS